ncbi:MAG: hypothetical protein ACNA7X_04780 [Dehalococcoidia bacterium]
MSSQPVPVAKHLTPCYLVPHEPQIFHYAVREQEMHRAKLFATKPLIRVIAESASQAQTDRLIVKGKDLVDSLVEAST